MRNNVMLRPLLRRISMQKNQILIIIILFIFLTVLRFIGLFGPEKFKLFVVLGFLLMWFLPFIFLTEEGRQQIGICKSNHYKLILLGILTAAISAFFIFLVGYVIYNKTSDNWFISIKNSYLQGIDTVHSNRFRLFLIFTIPAMVFSPIGEEFYFRGMVQEVFAKKWGIRIAAVINSWMFGLVHLFHHGIGFFNNKIHFHIVSGILWFIMIFVSSLLITLLRYKSNSLIPCIISHVTFNLIMNIMIFYFLI
jgi:uncharacterized protein